MSEEKEFPYETVYDYFAKRMVKRKLPNSRMPLGLGIVDIDDDGDIDDIDMLPPLAIAGLVRTIKDEGGILQYIRTMADMIHEESKHTVAIVMLAEAHMAKVSSVEELNTLTESDELPENMESVVSISVHTKDGMRFGMLPRGKDGQVKYAPLVSSLSQLQPMPRQKDPGETVH